MLKHMLVGACALLASVTLANAQSVEAGVTNGVAPSNTIGANGDYFVDLGTNYVFGPKASGVWPSTTRGNLMLNETVPVGADPTGVADSTTAIQNAVYAGYNDVYLPPGLYRVCNVLLPTGPYFHLHGAGTSTLLYSTPNTCANGVFRWNNYYGSAAFAGQTISDLAIDGTNYKWHLIDTTNNGNIDLNNIYINNLPATFDGIFVNGTSAISGRDVRINNLRAYQSGSLPVASALIEFGQYSGDSSLNNVNFNGNGKVTNAVRLDSGSADIHISGATHLYNTVSNVLYIAGSWNTIDGAVLDYAAAGDVVKIDGGLGHNTFNGGYIQGIGNGYSGVNIVGGSFNNFNNMHAIPISTAATSAIKSDSASQFNVVSVLDPGPLTSYTKAVDLNGTGDAAAGIPGVSNYALTNMATTGSGGSYVCLNSSGTFYAKTTACP